MYPQFDHDACPRVNVLKCNRADKIDTCERACGGVIEKV